MSFSDAHLAQLEARGIPAAEAERQLGLLRDPPPAATLRRPCTVGDGILRLEGSERSRLAQLWRDHTSGAQNERISKLRAQKFVPASGAATRMFQSLHALRARRDPESLGELQRVADEGDADAALAVELFDRIAETAISRPLARALCRPPQEVLAGGDYLTLLDAMLDEADGLGLGALPKALIPFHLYDDQTRTAIEEHLVEGIGYLGSAGPGRFHFTVSPAHRRAFEALTVELARRHAEAGVELDIGFSVQDPASDTIAIDAAGQPLVAEGGELVFRPAGHGALLSNLSQLDADVVFVKNIDNVLPAPAQGDTIAWKQALAGLAIEIQRDVFDRLDALESGSADLAAVWRFVDDRLGIEPPAGIHERPEDEQRSYLIDRLDRPLRVCGMVPNEGETGGGPFWVEGAGGELSPQIVESAQVDLGSATQRGIWARSTHFNPVDLVCCPRRRDGRAFDLAAYCDPSASFVAAKSHRGRPITVLERPGLWNGAMAGWNTRFVEVPTTTFSPVKTILDLLKPEHRVVGSPPPGEGSPR